MQQKLRRLGLRSLCPSAFQKRALKIQQQKQKEELVREQEREKELERERMLVAKRAK